MQYRFDFVISDCGFDCTEFIFYTHLCIIRVKGGLEDILARKAHILSSLVAINRVSTQKNEFSPSLLKLQFISPLFQDKTPLLPVLYCSPLIFNLTELELQIWKITNVEWVGINSTSGGVSGSCHGRTVITVFPQILLPQEDRNCCGTKNWVGGSMWLQKCD